MHATEGWEIERDKAQLEFSLRHIVISEIHGRFRSWGGEMTFDPDDVAATSLRVWVDLASIETGSAERDAHVMSPEFLDVARFPRAEFTSTAVTVRKDGEAGVTGSLQMHGITLPVELIVVMQRTWLDEQGLMRAAYTAQGEIDRQAFGLRWNQDLDVGGVVVGDRVRIEARFEMVRSADMDLARRSPAAPRPAAGAARRG
jgi:polyisoprenoid-binding protein YceI